MIYLDYAATSPLKEEVFLRMLPALKENFGNPDSLHGYGRKAAASVVGARDEIAGVCGVSSSEVYFTSGGTSACAYGFGRWGGLCRGNGLIRQ